MQISYLNGKFLPHDQCLIHIEDRGFQFADGVYEVTLFNNGKLIDNKNHINRLFRSLKELNIKHDFDEDFLTNLQLNLFAKNNINDSGYCYLNITRGTAERIGNHPQNIKPTINAFVRKIDNPIINNKLETIKTITHDDIRWLRCDIKSVGLCASAMIRQRAIDLGFDDAIMVRDNMITEATYANIFIVDEFENLITTPASNQILSGITRNRLIKIAKDNKIKVLEKKFDIDQLKSASEVFLTSSTLLIRPVSKIDETIINNGKIGKITKNLQSEYIKFVKGN